MSFEILGPLTVRVSSDVLPLKGLRHRRILAALLLEPNRTVSVSRLIDALWDERPPSTAREQVQNCVGGLRHSFDGWRVPATIRTQPAGYRLEVVDELVDAYRFESLRRQAHERSTAGNAKGAVQALRHALDLWHGNALEDVRTAVFEGAAARLDELRVRTAEEYVELLIGLGRAETAVAELRRWTHEQPYNERLHGQLMLGLFATGRSVEARGVLQQLRRRLRSELGIETEFTEVTHLATVSLTDQGAAAQLVRNAANQLKTALALLDHRSDERL